MNLKEFRVDSIELLNLRAIAYGTKQAVDYPSKSSRSLVEAGLRLAYLDGAMKAIEMVRDGLLAVK